VISGHHLTGTDYTPRHLSLQDPFRNPAIGFPVAGLPSGNSHSFLDLLMRGGEAVPLSAPSAGLDKEIRENTAEVYDLYRQDRSVDLAHEREDDDDPEVDTAGVGRVLSLMADDVTGTPESESMAADSDRDAAMRPESRSTSGIGQTGEQVYADVFRHDSGLESAEDTVESSVAGLDGKKESDNRDETGDTTVSDVAFSVSLSRSDESTGNEEKPATPNEVQLEVAAADIHAGSTLENAPDPDEITRTMRNARETDAVPAAVQEGFSDRDAVTAGGSVRDGDSRSIQDADAEPGEKPVRIQVRDLRQSSGEGNDSSGARNPDNGNPDNSEHASQEEATGSSDVRETRGGEDVFGRTARADSTVQSRLTRFIHDSGAGEIVKNARIILRNQDSGEMQLKLKPENLGTVRIRMEMQDRHIALRIIVENSSVREVFEQNLGRLAQAFREQGLETGAMEVSVGGHNGAADDRKDRLFTQDSLRQARELDEAVPVLDRFGYDYTRINLIA
jgi:hypothetical protein